MANTLSNLLNCVSNSSVHDCEYGCDAPYEELVVSIEEVTHAIEKIVGQMVSALNI